jgi:hypothetical protein
LNKKIFSASVQLHEILANIAAISWLFLALLCAISCFYYVAEMRFWNVKMEAQETEIVHFTAQRIGSHFEPAVADLLLLSESPQILTYLAHPGEAERTWISIFCAGADGRRLTSRFDFWTRREWK